jgi:low affinity Fe/Cu permease
MQKKRRHIGDRFEALSETITRWTGSTTAFASAIGVVVLWAVVGPLFRYSDTWQLVINTGTTVVTFMMVFLIQRAQNKDALAIHMKLNELVAALEGASNRLIEVEDLTEADLKVLQTHYRELARLAAEETEVGHSHSVEEARHRHTRKLQGSGIRDNNQGSGIRDKGSE